VSHRQPPPASHQPATSHCQPPPATASQRQPTTAFIVYQPMLANVRCKEQRTGTAPTVCRSSHSDDYLGLRTQMQSSSPHLALWCTLGAPASAQLPSQATTASPPKPLSTSAPFQMLTHATAHVHTQATTHAHTCTPRLPLTHLNPVWGSTDRMPNHFDLSCLFHARPVVTLLLSGLLKEPL
jgi:hypothetical protein